MTKKIGNALLIKRLVNRFQLSDLEPEILNLSETVIPVTDADAAVGKLRSYTGLYSISATGDQDILTAPAGKRYKIIAAAATLSTGTWTMNKIQIKAPGGAAVTVKSQTGAGTIYWQPTTDTYLDKAWQLSVTVDAYTGAGNMVTNVIVVESDGDNE
jgi:hypothetical protein